MVDPDERPNRLPRGARVSERDLVARARAGDEQALSLLFEESRGALRRRIGRRLAPAVRRRVSESDILQEAYLVASRKLEGFEFRGNGSFAAWLMQIAENAALTAARHHAGAAKRNALAEVSRDHRAQTDLNAGAAPSPSRRAMGEELRERLRQAMQTLSPDHRAVIEMLQHRRLTLAETAELTGRSVNAVKKLHARALAELARRVGVQGRETDGP